MERGCDRIKVMDTDRNLAPAPANRPVERLLEGHDTLDRFIVKSNPADNCCPKHGTNVREPRIDRERDPRRLHRVRWQAGLNPQVAPHCPCNTLWREEIRAVREELHIRMVLFNPFYIRSDEGDLVKNRPFIGTGEPLEIFKGEADNGHFRYAPSCDGGQV